MDAGITIKPVTGVAVADYVRPAAAAVQTVAPTDLPEGKAVNPLADSTPTQNNTPHPQAATATFITRGFVIDPQSREVIYRVLDTRTRQVLWQVPDAALLRSRAYAQALKEGSTQAASKIVTDIAE